MGEKLGDHMRVARAIAVLSFTLILGLAVPARGDDSRPTIGATKTAVLVWLADELGYIEDAGFQAKMFQSGTITSKALAEGDIQMATSSHVAFIARALKVPGLETVSTLSTSRTARLLGRKDLTDATAQALVGKSVGVTAGSFGEYMLSRFLLMNGVSMHDLQLRNMRPTEIVRELSEGELAAAITWEPYVYQARQALGDLTLDFPGQENLYYYFVLVARSEWLDSNEKRVADLLSALVRAETFAREDPARSKSLIARRYEVSDDFIDYLWPEHSLTVALPQDLVRLMEEAVLWRREIEKSNEALPMPNVLDYVRSAPLRSAAPEAVGLIE
ncbi:ABC transporter substrate-binding protein [Nisaea sp.]|uniref:ABC transporter substrate-binding protein n=1 Tax=Nisaea sp. TaxID=2024842 RepID=UPI003B5271B7